MVAHTYNPSTWEAEFEAILAYRLRPCLKKQSKMKYYVWHCGLGTFKFFSTDIVIPPSNSHDQLLHLYSSLKLSGIIQNKWNLYWFEVFFLGLSIEFYSFL
jgi:hypothetical protein